MGAKSKDHMADEEKKRYRNWIVTHNWPGKLPPEQGHEAGIALETWTSRAEIIVRHVSGGGKVLGVVGQLERGEQGTIHLQAVMRLTGASSLATARQCWPKAHLEGVKGTWAQAVAYVTKEETRIEGTKFCIPEGEDWFPRQGKRKDLDVIASLVKEGKPWEAIFAEVGGAAIRYVNQIEKVRRLLYDKPEHRVDGVKVALFYGDSGTGKSHTAWSPWIEGKSVSPEVYRVCHANWMDGYEQQKVLLIDDIDFRDWGVGNLLSALDKYAVQRQLKGGSVWAHWTHVVICHNEHHRNWIYKGAKGDGTGATFDQHAAIERRISLVVRFTGRYPQGVLRYLERGTWDDLHQAYAGSRPQFVGDGAGEDSGED